MTLVAFLQAQNCSNLPGSWRHPATMLDFLTPEYYQRITRTTRWRDSADDATCIAWARSVFEACKPFATGGVYVNFMPEEEKDRVANAYLGNAERLAAIKARYDPHNLFRINQN